MEWTAEAEHAIAKVPFFVRRRVRKRVEEEAARVGATIVALGHVETCRRRFLQNMDDEVKGFHLDTCFGSGGCPNRALPSEELVGQLERLLASMNLRTFLKERVKGPLKLHHEFRVSISDCPNACSRPQIVDLGIIGAVSPSVSDSPCSTCGACVEVCRERAVTLEPSMSRPSIDYRNCVSCRQCVEGCSTGTLVKRAEGFRVLIGGKLGRHPRLAREIPGIHSVSGTLAIAERCLNYYKAHNLRGERFGEMVERDSWQP